MVPVADRPRRALSADAVPGALLLRPLPLAGLILMGVNDHLLRVRWPGLITGKLSDVGVLLYLPALLVTGAEWLWLLRARRLTSLGLRRAHDAACLCAGLSLAALNLSPTVAAAYVDTLEFLTHTPHRYTLDPSDLWACLVLPLVAWDARPKLAADLERTPP